MSPTCACGKRLYRSRQEARELLRNVGWRVRVYRCPEFRGWHVTNQDKHARDLEKRLR